MLFKKFINMLTDSDILQLEEKGITVEQIKDQLEYFKNGFPYLLLQASASTEKGIMQIPENEQSFYLDVWTNYLEENKTIVKFVPASGAASRMFKDLFEFIDSPETEPNTPFLKTFFENIMKFAFYYPLQIACMENENRTIQILIKLKEYKRILKNLLFEPGLNYGSLSKGLLLFHRCLEDERTAMEEHLVEGALYACSASREVKIHFTVSPEHRKRFMQIAEEKKLEYAEQFNMSFHIDFSEQKPSTDTIAADSENQPFRYNGKLVFRPGGHGALIENLNDISADVIFIKNIDNVIPDRIKDLMVHYKKLLAGVLINYQKKIFDFLNIIDSGRYEHAELIEMLYFLQNELCIKNPQTKMLEDAELALYIKSKLNRPLRVCGMVRNQGEPGGGPFLVINSDGTISLQILESLQIDLNNPKMKQLYERGTHFNPVDLVCSLKNYRGKSFDLLDYVDFSRYFITEKSQNGTPLKAIENPGLWNGAMSDWLTVFVAVPLSTFSPVKTVNDLLRKEHNNFV